MGRAYIGVEMEVAADEFGRRLPAFAGGAKQRAAPEAGLDLGRNGGGAFRLGDCSRRGTGPQTLCLDCVLCLLRTTTGTSSGHHTELRWSYRCCLDRAI